MHRVRGDERALQMQHLEQRRQRPDLVGLLVDRDLPSASSAFAQPEANQDRAAANGSRSTIRNSRERASLLESPCSRRRNRRRNGSLRTAKSAMSTQVCPPHRFESSVVISISRKSWRVALLVRGSLGLCVWTYLRHGFFLVQLQASGQALSCVRPV